tara:strand:+ start:51 stop:734 length:684 start_codon:yes stop_codon:yes gene_type:complete
MIQVDYNRAFLFLHLGLGDHIICQGMVNILHSLYDELYIPVKHHNTTSVHHMCKDLKSVKLLPCDGDEEARELCQEYTGHWGADLLATGNHSNNPVDESVGPFDERFYIQLGVDFDESWNWHPKAPKETNQEILNLIPEEDFCFIHDDPSRGFNIDICGLPVVRNTVMGKTIFDYIPLLENATEIHCMDSSFALMIDRLPDLKVKKYIHRHVRGPIYPNYRSDWEII